MSVVVYDTFQYQLNSDEIYELYRDRKHELLEYHSTVATLEAVYNGDMNIPMPEIDKAEYVSSANLIQTGADQHSMRISSVMPNLTCPSMTPSNPSMKRANQRRLAYQGWWYLNKMNLLMARRARHLTTLASSPVIVRPGPNGIPLWEPKHPKETFPAPTAPDEIVPEDCIFCFERTAKWIRSRFPEFAVSLGRNIQSDRKLKLLQYISSDQISLCVIYETDQNQGAGIYAQNPGIRTMTLASTPNRAQRPLVIIPGRIGLDKLLGQFDQLVGMYATQSKLWSLQIHAVTREIFGETWAQSTNQGGVPSIETKANPYDNTIGIVRDGTIQQFRVLSSQGPNQAIDRIERNQRVTGAIPAEMGGEASSNIRTGRRGGQVFSAAVDFYVAEHQNILAASMEEELRAAIAVSKGWWGDTQKTLLVPLARGQVTYTPNITFETDIVDVSYAYAGTDSNTLVVGGGQRVAQKTLSRTSFMKIDPYVNDVEAEHDLIVKESIEDALLNSILQQAQMPDGPWQPEQLGRLAELVYSNDMPLWQAIKTIHEEAQAAQAQNAQQQQPGAPPGMAQQPGLNMPGAPGTPQASIQPGTPDQQNLSMLLNNLRRPQRGIQ